MQCLSYAFQLGAELVKKAFDGIQPRAKLSGLLPVQSVPSIARSQSLALSPMPNSTIARDGGYDSVTMECGASGLVAEEIGQSVRWFTLRVRLRAFVADQEFRDRARHVVHPTDLERANREALRWSDASTRDENSHAGLKSKAQANAPSSTCRQCPLRSTAIQNNEATWVNATGRPTGRWSMRCSPRSAAPRSGHARRSLVASPIRLRRSLPGSGRFVRSATAGACRSA